MSLENRLSRIEREAKSARQVVDVDLEKVMPALVHEPEGGDRKAQAEIRRLQRAGADVGEMVVAAITAAGEAEQEV